MSPTRARSGGSLSLGVLGAVLFLAVAPGASRPQQQAQPPAQPVFRAGVELLTIDVAVLGRDDQVIEGLTPDDFTVTIDGVPRRVATFRFVRAGAVEVETPSTPAAAPAPAASPAPPAPGRTVVIVVSRDQIPAGDGRSFLEAAGRFVDSLAPTDRVGLWTLPVAAPGLRFVEDRAQLKQALLASAGTARPRMSDVKMSPDEAVAIEVRTDRRVRQDVIQRECMGWLGSANLERCAREVDIEARDLVRTLEADALTMLSALQRLIQSLAPIEGPKHVVVISMGTYITPDQLRQAQAVVDAAAAARVHLHALQLSNRLEAARADIRGLSSVPQFNQWDSADVALAGLTGGLVVTTNAGEAAFERLRRVLAAAYILGVETEPGDRDGRTHKVEVRLARREGLTVRARQQFRIDPAAVAARPPVAAPPPREARPTEAPPTTTSSTPRAAGRSAAAVAETLAGLTAYIESFEREFSSAVAEERYVQIVRPWRGNPRSPSDEKALEWTEPGQKPKSSGPIIARRLLLSDVLLVQIPGERWLGYRDVAAVDGQAIRDRTERVRELFLSKSADREGQLRRVADESGRYNLGTFKRNLNLPTLSLFLLHPRHQARFEFELSGEQTIDGARLQVIRYRERQRPTLIGTSDGRDVPVEGRLWIDPSAGSVVQTEIRFEPMSERRASILVRYRREAPFAVLVPDYMWEWYESGDVDGRVMTDRTLVECLARYANYRQFRVETLEQIR